MRRAVGAFCLVLAACRGVRPAPPPRPAQATYFVATDGDDRWSGKQPAPDAARSDGPFATLERARDAVRELARTGALPVGGAIVEVRGGRYELHQPFVLTASDSGTERAPIVYRAAAGERVVLSGGRAIEQLDAVTDRQVRERLDPAARDHVVRAELPALGVRDFGSPEGGGVEVFFDDRPLTLARWPNRGFVEIAGLAGEHAMAILGHPGNADGVLVYSDERPSRWLAEPDAWLHGFWFWDWADQRERIAAIDPAHHTIALAPPYHQYGYREGQWYYAFNLLAELDEPGEWYLDRERGTLYVWPPSAPRRDSLVVSVLPTLVEVRGASYVTLRGLELEHARDTAVTITDASHVSLADATIQNVGGWAVKIRGGDHDGVTGCEIAATGEGGIALDGGDRATLAAAGHYADDNHIHDIARWLRTNAPAILVAGVGNRATHNLIHDTPSIAIQFAGNDHLIELNELHDVATEGNDTGAIYAGRDWTMRGTVIRHNYLHDIRGREGRGANGIYLDDMFSGTEVVGNVFYRVTRAVFIGGGRDNVVANNLFVECGHAVHLDARASTWAADSLAMMKQRLAAMPYREQPWRSHYPKLVDILDHEPGAPRGNKLVRNISWHGQWSELVDGAGELLELDHNLIDADPALVDATFGFDKIPFDQIGPRRHVGWSR